MSASMRHGGRFLRNLSISVRFLAYPQRYPQTAALSIDSILKTGSLRKPVAAILCESAAPRSFSSTSNDDSSDQDVVKSPLDLAKPGGAARRQAEQDTSSSDSSSSSDDESSSDEENLDPAVVSAAGEVAKQLAGDEKTIRSDLVQRLRDHVKLTNAQRQGQPPPTNISSVISGMKVRSSRQPAGSHGPPKQHERRPERRPGRTSGNRDHHSLENVKLFSGRALGIFSPADSPHTTDAPMTLFRQLEAEERRSKMTFPPANAFEEMIHWTEEGKVWRFPIDNEQGMEEEAEVGFQEHVFLEHLLEDFPKRGPVRHFMELVTVGLSKNPYLTVKQKHDHIYWYQEYFKDKYKHIEELTIAAKEA